MNDGMPGIGVEVVLESERMFGSAAAIERRVDELTDRVVSEVARAEKAADGMLNFAGATARVQAFGAAATRELHIIGRSNAQLERQAEGMIKSFDRQTAVIGKTRDEQRTLVAEQIAGELASRGMTEAADRLRAAEIMKADAHAAASAAVRSEVAAIERATREHQQLAAAVRGSQAAQIADAEAAERLRMSTDPLYAATSRLNAEIAESTRLYHAGATAPAEYARQQQVLIGRLNGLSAAYDANAVAARRGSGTMTQLSFQLNDIATMAAMGAPPMQIFASQAGQIFQVAQMAEGGVKGFAAELGRLAIALAPFALVAGVAAGAFGLFSRAVSSGIDTKGIVDDLGLTRAEIKRLKDVTVDTGDVVSATFTVIARNIGLNMSEANKGFGSALDWMTETGRKALASLYANYVGTFKAIGSIVSDVFSGKGIDEILKNARGEWNQAYEDANAGMKRFSADVRKQIEADKRASLEKQAADLKADRSEKKPKADRHAEQLEREARAIEAQIKNLYALGDAYAESGAAALIAEARVKAESQAIKGRADVEAAVERQIRLAIAQRVSDAEKGAAAMRDQAAAQDFVNRAVAAGQVPAALANEMLQDRLADIPLLDALEVARAKKELDGIAKATAALDRQRDARQALNDQQREAQRLTALEAGRDQLALLALEARLIGETDAARQSALATLRAEQEARRAGWDGDGGREYVLVQTAIAEKQAQLRIEADAFNDSLTFQADRLDLIANNAQNAARGMADAFGEAGRALGDMAAIFSGYIADQERAETIRDRQLLGIKDWTDLELKAHRTRQINTEFALRQDAAQIGMLGDMTAAAKGFFDEKSKGYAAVATAEKAFRAVEFALSVRAMAQDAKETVLSIANAGARAASDAVAAVAKAISTWPFPANLAAGAATAAALASIGLSVAGSFGGGGRKPEPANEGRGTVFGDPTAQSDSIKRSIDALREVDTLTLNQSREMAASLKSIDSQIGGFASAILRNGNVNASAGVREGFASDSTGKLLQGIVTGGGLFSKIPVIGGLIGGIGGLIGSLFGSKTSVIGNGLYGGPQSLGNVLGGGFDASYYSDIEKTKKFLGITTGKSYSTRFTGADADLENQFTLILRSFNDAIRAAAGPLGAATGDIQNRLNGFVVNIGKIDLKGLTGEQIEERLTAVFGAAADRMADAAFPGIARFQKVGEGAFETLVRVASTVEAVTSSLAQLGGAARDLGVDAKLGLADQFESIGAMTSAIDGYFERFYTKEEQNAARTAQLTGVFASLGVAMPSTLAGFRALVEAQNLTTAAGQSTYATLLQLAPAFADLKSAMEGAKSAADILAERQDLERRLLQVQGDTAALRALDLAKLDASNRAIQEQIWAIEDAQEAVRAAEELRDAWGSVGDTIMDEVKRIRGLDSATGQGGFASLLGQFNAANAAARGGDLDAAKNLPGLSQALLAAAGDAATSRQELARVQAQTAAALEATYASISGIKSVGQPATTTEAILANAKANVSMPSPNASNDTAVSDMRALRDEIAALRRENNDGHAKTAGNTGRIASKLDDVTQESGGDVIAVRAA